MGSGERRKDKDTVIIRRPKKIIEGLPKGSGVGIADTAADTCPAAFRVKLKINPHIKDGAAIRLVKQSGVYVILISTTEIGKLNAPQTAIVDRCAGLGVLYSGMIVISNNQPYAAFTRKL